MATPPISVWKNRQATLFMTTWRFARFETPPRFRLCLRTFPKPRSDSISISACKTEGPLKILVIQLRRLGDILLTTPAVRYLKQIFPEAQIDFLCEPVGRPLLENNRDIAELLI